MLQVQTVADQSILMSKGGEIHRTLRHSFSLREANALLSVLPEGARTNTSTFLLGGGGARVEVLEQAILSVRLGVGKFSR